MPSTSIHLSNTHQDLLYTISAIGKDEVARRGYYTQVDAQALRALGHPAEPAYVSSLVIPIFDVHGRNGAYQLRLDHPPPDPDKPGKLKRYLWPAGARMVIDVHPDTRLLLSDPKTTLYITEGIRKADSAVTQGLCCVALIGVTCWRGKNGLGGVVALPDWNKIALNDNRPVRLTFDSDCRSNPRVLAELLKLGDFLMSKGAAVSVVVLPPGPNGEKVGFDDWFAAKHTPIELDALTQPLEAFAKHARMTIRDATTADLVHVLANLGYTFRLNEVTGLIEVNGAPMSDELDAKILSDMADVGYEREKRITNAYKAHAYDERYNPIKDYLNGLTWDGKPTIARLATYFEDSHDPIYDETTGATVSLFELYLRRWLVGAVAKVMAGEQNPVLVPDGDQDLGKSAFARWLCSGMPDYFAEGPIDPHDKDFRLKLASNWIWEVGEIDDTTNKAAVSALKNFITTGVITDRPAFGRYARPRLAICSLIGTINSTGAGFLHDTTGNRRFLVVALKHINWGYQKDIDVDQLWAEAVALYRSGFPWRLLPDEAARQRAENEKYEPDDPIAAVLIKYCEIDTAHAVKGDADWFTLSANLLELIAHHNKCTVNKRLSMELSATAKKMGLLKGRETVNGKQQPGYYGIRLDAAQAAADDDAAIFPPF